MLADALPASLNKIITSLMRFRKKIIIAIKSIVSMVEIIDSPKNILIRLLPIVSSGLSPASTL